MRLAIVVIAAVSVAALLSACGGGSGGVGGGGSEREPEARLLLEADFSQLPEGIDTDAMMTILVDVLQRRVIAFGAVGVDIERQGSNRVSVTLGDSMSEKDARQLMVKNAILEFRQPVLDENGDIVCEAADGNRFSIPTNQVGYPTSGVSRLPVCLTGKEKSGDIVWEPATATDSQADAETITPIQPIVATVDRTRDPIVVMTFAPSGAKTLQQISERLIGLPLGIFIDGDLVAGPTVQEPITTGNVAIAGLSLSEANILAAQLSTGGLPVPLRAISAEETP